MPASSLPQEQPSLLWRRFLARPRVPTEDRRMRLLLATLLALAPFTDKIAFLEEGDWVVLNRLGALVSFFVSTAAIVTPPAGSARRRGRRCR